MVYPLGVGVIWQNVKWIMLFFFDFGKISGGELLKPKPRDSPMLRCGYEMVFTLPEEE